MLNALALSAYFPFLYLRRSVISRLPCIVEAYKGFVVSICVLVFI